MAALRLVSFGWDLASVWVVVTTDF